MSCNWFPTKVHCFHECLLTQFRLFALNISVCTNTEHQGNRYPAARNSASPPRNLYAAAQYARNRYDSPGWWNFNQNSNTYFRENAFECGVCKIVAILSRPQCVNSMTFYTDQYSASPSFPRTSWCLLTSPFPRSLFTAIAIRANMVVSWEGLGLERLAGLSTWRWKRMCKG